MKIILDIKDNKVAFFLEMLKNFTFIKQVTPISNSKANFINEIKDALNELELVKEGKLDAKSADDLINEL
ncbi:MAG: hypothetical protein KF732_11410 [Flavobacteriales bacterium]|nr:hypothetical protein [Flavobacteriales bacterium]HRN41959.1 hypothetical protein [Vicingus sp.]HRP59555.1 hypothetical protein [Vicingus sp.]